MRTNRIPALFAPISIQMGRWLGGENLIEHDPVEALLSAGKRPVWVLHSMGDTRIGVHHSHQLQAAAEGAGVNATFWYVDDIAHVRVPGALPDEFRTRLGGFFRQHLGAP
jgi:dipeptidyl aminopeptidase/acylaminoacyl peptidase